MTAPDVLTHRAWLTSLVDLPTQGLVIDLGCGRGQDLLALAERAKGPGVRFEGIDRSVRAIEAATAASADRPVADGPVVAFRVHESHGTLPWSDASIDVLYSHNLLECIADKEAWLREVIRVLRPRGQVVCAHWDWDSQLYDAVDKALVRRVVHAFADWKQGWMDASDGWMGRRLWGVFQESGMFEGHVEARVMTNTLFAEPWYGHARARDCGSMVKHGLISQDDYETFLGDITDTAKRGRYFYAITGFAYVGRRAR